MSIFIVESKDLAKLHWSQIKIGTEGEIYIDLGYHPSTGELSEIEKVAVRYEPEKDGIENVYIMKDSDYIVSFYKLSQKIFSNLFVLESDIGRIIAHQLETLQFAEHYYGR